MDQITMFDVMYPPVSIDSKIRLIELFAGYGSQAMALRNLGADFETYKVVEFDKYAIASYNAVHGTDFPALDVRNVSGKDLDIVDKDKYTYILVYSFPCTDISIAGKQEGMVEGSETRSALLWEVQRILSDLNSLDALPQILLMENVTAIHSPQNMGEFRRWLDYLENLGYENNVQDLNAADFVIPQHRERTFCLSTLGKYNYKFPVGIPTDKCIEDYFEDMTDEELLQYVVKSKEANDLLVRLNENGELD